MKKYAKLAAAAAASLMVGAAQADQIIDLFNGSQSRITQDDSTDPILWATQYGPDATVKGLYRDIAVKKTNDFGDPDQAGTSASVFSGTFNWNVDAAVEALAVVRWDGSLAGSGTVDAQGGISNHFLSSSLATSGISPVLSMGLGDSFIFDVVQSDLDFTFWFELYDTSGNYSKFKLESQAHLASVSTPIPLQGFVNQCAGGPSEFADPTDADNNDVLAGICSSSSFDIANIGAIQIILESVPGAGSSVDLRVSALKVVPEPGSLALFGLALVGMVARRRLT